MVVDDDDYKNKSELCDFLNCVMYYHCPLVHGYMFCQGNLCWMHQCTQMQCA